jgi:predicted nucleic acid-binding protein
MTQLRVAIDTNILLSAFVFSSGKLGIFRQLWQDKQIDRQHSKLLSTGVN